MSPWDRFSQVVADRHGYARRWKERTGGKVVGYLCTYVPEEYIYAAGALPVRVLGGHEPQDVTEPHISAKWCSFCRDCLAQGLLGRYDYLDGITIAQSCFHIQQTYDSWERHIPISFSHHIYMPSHIHKPSALECLETEFQEFKEHLEEWTGQAITPQRLQEAVTLVDDSRRLMLRAYELRQAECPPISGTQAMEMVLASQVMDRREHSRLLEEALAGLAPQGEGCQDEVRLMLLGSENDDVDFVRMVEGLGATVVTDDHCTGSRSFWNTVDATDGDPMGAIARRYFTRPPCPQKDVGQHRVRLEHITSLARDFRVRGAIILLQKFCDPHGFDLPPVQQALRDMGVPTLFLESDVTLAAGQFRTRVEAFLETLQLEVV
ncbi:MAG: 2-hydroxyacyl-CoA dehydratase [Dehalococcoidia bacterium]